MSSPQMCAILCVTSSYTLSHHHTTPYVMYSVTSSYKVICHTCKCAQYLVSHHHTLCHIITQHPMSYTVSHHHSQCHIIIHSVTSSYKVLCHTCKCAQYLVSHHHTPCHIITQHPKSYQQMCVSERGSARTQMSERARRATNQYMIHAYIRCFICIRSI
jgi:hypothetical protein